MEQEENTSTATASANSSTGLPAIPLPRKESSLLASITNGPPIDLGFQRPRITDGQITTLKDVLAGMEVNTDTGDKGMFIGSARMSIVWLDHVLRRIAACLDYSAPFDVDLTGGEFTPAIGAAHSVKLTKALNAPTIKVSVRVESEGAITVVFITGGQPNGLTPKAFRGFLRI